MQNTDSFQNLLKSYIITLKEFYGKNLLLTTVLVLLLAFSAFIFTPAGIIFFLWMFALIPLKKTPKSKDTLLTKLFYSSLVLSLIWISIILNPYNKFMIIAFDVIFLIFIYFFYLYIQKQESKNKAFSLR